MNAQEVIESYVTDVAVQLPRRQRNDVAFELRALIDEGLRDRAEAAGRPADADMAIEFLRAFGRPSEVAARYRPVLNIIDPADAHAFVRASVIGLLVIWSAGLWRHFSMSVDSGSNILLALGRWWGDTLIPSMWWPGVLVAGFGTSSWLRARSPQPSQWRPRSGDRLQGGRVGLIMGIIGVACGTALLVDPKWILDYFWNGHAAPAAYQALTYTDGFLAMKAPLLFGLLLLNIPIMFSAIVQGRWSPRLRRIEAALGLASCAVMAWSILDGPVFMAVASDKMIKLSMSIIIVFIVIGMGVKLHRSVTPGPDPQAQA